MKRAVQYFSDEYLEQCKVVKSEQIVEFLENFKALHFRNRVGPKGESDLASGKSILISLKVPEMVLASFKMKAQLEGLRYQTQIKALMIDWLQR